MGTIRDVVSDAKADALHVVVETGGDKYLCFTRLTGDSWILNVSDGYDLWRQELDMDELDAHRDLADVSTLDAYLGRFRTAFLAGDIQVTQTGVKVSLRVGQGAKTLNFELYEAKAVEKKTELQHILFHLAEKATDLESRLEKANHQVESLRQHKAKAAEVDIFDVDTGKKKGQPKVAPKTARMSVINPGSRKRKAPRGVEFD